MNSSSASSASKKNKMSSKCVLNEDFYPDIWEDNAKMSVYLNTFRPRTVNPAHYDAKMKFWKDMIQCYCDYKGSAKFNIAELKHVFKRNGVMPYCLDEVVTQMIAEQEIESKDQFMLLPKSSLAGWAIDSLVMKPLSWGFGKLKEKIISSALDEETVFVDKRSLKRQSGFLLQHIRGKFKSNSIVSLDDIMEEVDQIDEVSRDGVVLVLHYLSTQEKSVFIEEVNESAAQNNHHKLLLKFAEIDHQVAPITEIERSVYNLEQTEKFLHETIEKKEEQLDQVLVQVKGHLKDGKKQLAKTYLRKKHLLEADIVKTMDVLDNIQSMLIRVHASKSDKDILNMYKMGSEAIKSTFKDAGVNLDNVHDIIEDMQEIYSNQEEFENAISEPMRGPNSVDDSDLEKELLELMEPSKDKNISHNDGGTSKSAVTKIDDLDQLDRELEMRLRRLRSDIIFDESESRTPQTAKPLT